MESINKMLTKQTNVTIAFGRDKNYRRAINEAGLFVKTQAVATVDIFFCMRNRHTDI